MDRVKLGGLPFVVGLGLFSALPSCGRLKRARDVAGLGHQPLLYLRFRDGVM